MPAAKYQRAIPKTDLRAVDALTEPDLATLGMGSQAPLAVVGKGALAYGTQRTSAQSIIDLLRLKAPWLFKRIEAPGAPDIPVYINKPMSQIGDARGRTVFGQGSGDPKFIEVARDLSPGEVMGTIAHELGHVNYARRRPGSVGLANRTGISQLSHGDPEAMQVLIKNYEPSGQVPEEAYVRGLLDRKFGPRQPVWGGMRMQTPTENIESLIPQQMGWELMKRDLREEIKRGTLSP